VIIFVLIDSETVRTTESGTQEQLGTVLRIRIRAFVHPGSLIPDLGSRILVLCKKKKSKHNFFMLLVGQCYKENTTWILKM
jgi:hypothetical protein